MVRGVIERNKKEDSYVSTSQQNLFPFFWNQVNRLYSGQPSR